ncbi:MAG: ABC transporter substrate-binding protein [Candidatus Cloacimonetes bacterium]|nr:ABC transporter substrate-binding protein [Candidatus Cloacimonadota bacterium]
MTRKVLLITLIAVCTLLSLFTCNQKQKMVLRIGTNPEYPPNSYRVGNQFAGIDIDIGKKIAEKLGVDYQIVPLEFEQLLPSLAVNKIDVAISAITITPERTKIVDFSAPYSVTNQVLISRQDSPMKINRLEDLGKCTIGSLGGTTGSFYIDENLIEKDLMPKANLKLYATNIEAIGKMLDGELDLVIIDESAALGYAKQKPIKIAYVIRTNEQYGVAMQKGKKINEKINQALNELITSGEVKAIIASHIR